MRDIRPSFCTSSANELVLEAVNTDGIDPLETDEGTSHCPYCGHENYYNTIAHEPCEHLLFHKAKNNTSGKVTFLWWYKTDGEQ